jgi:hypothetical protein
VGRSTFFASQLEKQGTYEKISGKLSRVTARIRYLKLQEPVDVAYSPDEKPMDNDAPTKNIKVVQLIVDYDMPYKKLIINGRRVKIKGSLFSKLTGHHHARILLNIDSLEVSK